MYSASYTSSGSSSSHHTSQDAHDQFTAPLTHRSKRPRLSRLSAQPASDDRLNPAFMHSAEAVAPAASAQPYPPKSNYPAISISSAPSTFAPPTTNMSTHAMDSNWVSPETTPPLDTEDYFGEALDSISGVVNSGFGFG